MATLISDKTDFRTKKITRHRKRYYTMIKSSIHQEDIAILCVWSKNNRAAKYVTQKTDGTKRRNK